MTVSTLDCVGAGIICTDMGNGVMRITVSATGSGSGASSLAIGTGSLVAVNIVSSPTAVVNFDSTTFILQMTADATAYVALGPLVPLLNSTNTWTAGQQLMAPTTFFNRVDITSDLYVTGITSMSKTVYTSTNVVVGGYGTAQVPAIGWLRPIGGLSPASDGFYFDPNALGIGASVGNAQVLTITGNSLNLNSNKYLLAPGGGLAAPDITFVGDQGSGLTWTGAAPTRMALAMVGRDVVRFNSTGYQTAFGRVGRLSHSVYIGSATPANLGLLGVGSDTIKMDIQGSSSSFNNQLVANSSFTVKDATQTWNGVTYRWTDVPPTDGQVPTYEADNGFVNWATPTGGPGGGGVVFTTDTSRLSSTVTHSASLTMTSSITLAGGALISGVTVQNLTRNRVVFSTGSGQLVDYPFLALVPGFIGNDQDAGEVPRTVLLSSGLSHVVIFERKVHGTSPVFGVRQIVNPIYNQDQSVFPTDGGGGIQSRNIIPAGSTSAVASIVAFDGFTTNDGTGPIISFVGTSNWVQNRATTTMRALIGSANAPQNTSIGSTVDVIVAYLANPNETGQNVQRGVVREFYGLQILGMGVELSSCTTRAMIMISSQVGNAKLGNYTILSYSTAPSVFAGAIALGFAGSTGTLILGGGAGTTIAQITASTASLSNYTIALPDNLPSGDDQVVGAYNTSVPGSIRTRWITPPSASGGSDNLGSHLATMTFVVPSPFGFMASTSMVVSSGTGNIGFSTPTPATYLTAVFTDSAGVVNAGYRGATNGNAAGFFNYMETKPSAGGTTAGVNFGWVFNYFSSMTIIGTPAPFIGDAAISALMTVDGGNTVHNTASLATAFNGIATYQGLGSFGRVTGVTGSSSRVSSGTITTMEAARFSLSDTSNKGVVTTPIAVHILTPALSAGATWFSNVGIKIDTQTMITGGVQTSTAFSILSEGRNDQAFFAGRMGIGFMATSTYTLVVSTSPDDYDLAVSTRGHLTFSGSSPTVTACGAAPSGAIISGTDNAGTIQVGGGVTTSCTLNFAQPYRSVPGNPACQASSNSGTAFAFIDTANTNNEKLVVGLSATLGGGIITYHCDGVRE